MPNWVINLIFLAIERWGEKLFKKLSHKLKQKSIEKKHKNDLEKAAKLNDRSNRIAVMAAHIKSASKQL